MTQALILGSLDVSVVRAHLIRVGLVEVPFVWVLHVVMVLVEPETVLSGWVSVEGD